MRAQSRQLIWLSLGETPFTDKIGMKTQLLSTFLSAPIVFTEIGSYHPGTAITIGQLIKLSLSYNYITERQLSQTRPGLCTRSLIECLSADCLLLFVYFTISVVCIQVCLFECLLEDKLHLTLHLVFCLAI